MDSDEFRKQVKDALEHLYDTAYLQVHPLLSQITDTATPDQLTRAQKLRGLLKDAIETLRPHPSSPSGSPREAWRSYLALRYRYVQWMSMAQIEDKMGISLRQLQRELHKGLDALSALLMEKRVPESGPALVSTFPASGSAQELENELRQWQLERQAYQVQALVDAALTMLKPLMDQRAVQLVVDLPADLPPVLVDATLMRQALFKVLRVMAQDSGGVISLRADQSNEEVEIILHCSSCAPSTMEEEWQMVELLVNHQGGKLTMNVRSALGTHVTLSLPGTRQTRVLVIDDNPSIHQLFERYLAPHHYTIIHARSGPEALQLAVEAGPDLITLDVMMPNMDGWQVLRDLAQNPATAHLPVVICSVLKEPELAFSLGARAYLKKPVERLELLATLERLKPKAGRAPASPPPALAGS